MNKWLYSISFAALAVVSLVAVACNDDDDDVNDGDASPSGEEIAEIEELATMLAETDPSDPAQVEFFLAHATDSVLEDFFGFTREECAANPEECIGDPVPVERLEGTEVTEDTARTTVYSEDESVFTLSLVLEDDLWMLEQVRFGPAGVPAGVTAIGLQLNEYAFGFNSSEIEDGNIAFEFENVGEEPHEVVLLKTNAGYDLDVLLESFEEEDGEGDEDEASPAPEEEGEDEELPPGVDALYFGGFAGPGQGGIAVFPEPLEPGAYSLVCFFPDPEGTPHATLGMTADFEVPAE